MPPETMIERMEESFDLKPDRRAGDVAYRTGPPLGWRVARDIDPHIPLWDRSQRDDGTVSRTDFSYDKEGDLYICPGGKTLKTTGRGHDGKTLHDRAGKLDREACPMKLRCGPKSPARRISRDVNEAAP